MLGHDLQGEEALILWELFSRASLGFVEGNNSLCPPWSELRERIVFSQTLRSSKMPHFFSLCNLNL